MRKRVWLGTLAVGFALSMRSLHALPEFWLPEDLYAAPGLECNVYYGEVFFSGTPPLGLAGTAPLLSDGFLK